MSTALALPPAAFQESESAFARLVEDYQARVYHFCLRLLGEPDEAEDAAQETFLRAYQHRRRYDPSRPLGTWLLAIAAHHCIDRLRRRRQVWLGLDEQAVLMHPALRDSSPGPEAAALLAEQDRELRAQVRRLPARDRDAILLHYWGYLSYAEIAEATGSTATAVKSRLHRARGRLAGLLRQSPARLAGQRRLRPEPAHRAVSTAGPYAA
jgi:RNA polymerase sigma-70 factor (ECF subfamily)